MVYVSAMEVHVVVVVVSTSEVGMGISGGVVVVM